MLKHRTGISSRNLKMPDRCRAISPTIHFRWVVLLSSLLLATSVLADEQTQQWMREAQLASEKGDHVAALALLDKVVAAEPSSAPVYYVRGRERFRAGNVEGSVADFDKLVELDPKAEPRQWERGIALYYVGKFERGAQQFVLYQTFHDQDVENSVWRWLCQARAEDRDKATAAMLPIAADRRVPMMEIYDLYRGKGSIEKVLAAVEAGAKEGPGATWSRFYANLYIGLYLEATGDEAAAKPYILAAADKFKVNHYMWDVAAIHAKRFREKEKKE
jgi:lipoprotein NlpI